MNKQKVERFLSFATKSPSHAANVLISNFETVFELAEMDMSRLSDLLNDRSLALYLKVVSAVVSRRGCDRLKVGKIHTDAEIKDFLVHLFFGLSVESIYVLSFDRSGAYIACDKVGEGSVNYSNAIPRKFIEVCARHGAASLIIAHNHPGGYATPSSEDVFSTNMLRQILAASGLRLLCHYIVAEDVCTLVE